MAADTEYIVINAVGPYEFGGACVNNRHNRHNILQVASQGGGVGIMEYMMPHIFPKIFKTPYEVQDGFEITDGEGKKVEGGRTIWANDRLKRSKLKAANQRLDSIIKKSIGALIRLGLPNTIGEIKDGQALSKDQVKTLSGFCFENQTTDQSVTMLNVAGLNFNPKPRDSRHFKAIHQSYEGTKEKEGWTEEEVKEYYTKLANNIFDQIAKGDDKKKVVYFKIPGTDIFNPYHSAGTKSPEYKKYKDLVEDAMFAAIAEKCKSYIRPKITFQFDNPEKLKRLVVYNQNISIKKCAQDVADFMKVAQDPVVSAASKAADKGKKTEKESNIIGLKEGGEINTKYAGDKNYYTAETIRDNASDTVFVFGANAGHTTNRTGNSGDMGQAAQVFGAGTPNVLPIITRRDSLPEDQLNFYKIKTQEIIRDFVAHGGKVVFPLTTGGKEVNVGTNRALNPKMQEWATDLYKELQEVRVIEHYPTGAMQRYNDAMNDLQQTMKKREELRTAAENAVERLNAGKYSIGGSKIHESKNSKYPSNGTALKREEFILTSSSTTGAIFTKEDPNVRVIIHNFANENTIGGRPGIEGDSKGKFIAEGTPSSAQEESLFHSSTLAASLLKFAKSKAGQLIYGDEFNTTSKAIISRKVTFFAKNYLKDGFIDWNRGEVDYVKPGEERQADVVTVAAQKYDKGKKNDIADTVKRIREQLAASAHLAHKNYEEEEGKQSHIVMGAFGCGAFNNDPKLIASIYRKFLLEKGGEFNRAFPEGTTFEFAIPLSKREHDIVESEAPDTTGYPNVRNHGAFDKHLFKQTKLIDYDYKEYEIEQAINNTKIKSAEVESKKENTIKFLQDEDIANVESFMKWNEDFYEKLKRDPKNKGNLKLFLNPQKEDGTKVFAGWGGRLSHERDNIFNINHVIDGGFADKIGLKKGDKIEIDLNHEDFKKNGKQFEGEMLEAALINKLRAGNLEGIKKIGTINLQKDSVKTQLTNLYNERKKLFINEMLQGDEVQKDDKINEFLQNNLKEKLKEIEEATKKLHEFIDKSYQEYIGNRGKDNEERKTGIYNKDYKEQKPLIIFPVGIRGVGGGGVEEAKNNYDSYERYLRNNNISVSGRNVYSVISIGQDHWEFLKFKDNKDFKEIKNRGHDNACGAYVLVGIITDNEELRGKLNIHNIGNLEERTKNIISNGDTELVSSLSPNEVRKIIEHLLEKQAEQEEGPEKKERIEKSKTRVGKHGEMIESCDLEIACEAIGIAFCTPRDFDPIQQKIEYFNNLLFDDDNNIKTGSDLYKKFKTANPEIDEEIIKEAIINFASAPAPNPAAASVREVGQQGR